MLQKHSVPFTLGWTDLLEAQREALMLENGQPVFFLQISGVTWHYYIKKNKKKKLAVIFSRQLLQDELQRNAP